MKRTILIVIGILLALAVIGLLTYLFLPKPSQQTSDGGTTFPTTGDGGTFIVIPGTDTQVRDFLSSPDTKEDPVNEGYYYLGNQPSDDAPPPYLIEYVKETQYFNIVLLAEPLGENRRAAESYLMQALGLKEEQLCGLDYTLGVPNSVNSVYAGTNLGFSFCPGAVTLP